MTEITGFGDLSNSQDDASLITFIARQLMNGIATTSLVLVKAVHDETVDVQPMVNQIDGKGWPADATIDPVLLLADAQAVPPRARS